MSTKSDVQTQTATKAKRRTARRHSKELYLRPADLGSLFSKRPVILGEKMTDYDEFLSKVTIAMKPRDIIEAIWVKDYTDLVWESQRLRRLKDDLLRRGAREALEEVLAGIEGADVIEGATYSIPSIAACYSKGLKQAVTHIHGIFAKHHLDNNVMTERAFAFHIDTVERVERMIAGIDARRNRVISDFERYRDGGRRRSGMITDDVIDVS